MKKNTAPQKRNHHWANLPRSIGLWGPLPKTGKKYFGIRL